MAGVAGTAVLPGVNLLDGLADIVGSCSTTLEAHAKVMTLCADAAPLLREHYAAVVPVTPLPQPVAAVILLGSGTGHARAGDGREDLQLVAYGVSDTGPPAFQSLGASVVYAPASVQFDAERMALSDTRTTPVLDQIEAWGSRLRELAPLVIARQRLDISPDYRRQPPPARTARRHLPAWRQH